MSWWSALTGGPEAPSQPAYPPHFNRTGMMQAQARNSPQLQRPTINTKDVKNGLGKPQGEESYPMTSATTTHRPSPSEYTKSAVDKDSIPQVSQMSPESIDIARTIFRLRSQYETQLAAMEKSQARITNLSSLPIAKKVWGEAAQLDKGLNRQIEGQAAAIKVLEKKLADVLQAQLKDKIKAELMGTIQVTVKQRVKEAVEMELQDKSLGDIKDATLSRSRTYYEHEVEIHNLNARRHNSNLPVNSKERLHQLWLPPHPINNSQIEPPSPSKLFPKDMEALYKLSADDLKTLLQEYGGEELVSSALQGAEELMHREKYLNKFMHLIGIPSNIVRVSPQAGNKDKPVYYVFTDNSTPLPPILSFA
ncbi:hypothetical protein AX16_003979 [Volvariella volvacea WC 439]|nr:hypothetical protein AX16_003979 [Volvariella volvacea WC 439]